MSNLGDFAKEYKNKLAKYRTVLAEIGYEFTYLELQGLLADMDEQKIEVTKDNVINFIKKSRNDDSEQ